MAKRFWNRANVGSAVVLMAAAAAWGGEPVLGKVTFNEKVREERVRKLKERPRKFFAHYMGCFPVGRGATQHHRKSAAGFLGESRQFNLVPFDVSLTAKESADLEIRRAVRIGVDGFAVDTWAGGIGAKDTLDALFWVAEEKDYPIEITICLDYNSLGESPRPGAKDAIRYLMDLHGDSPKLARRDGKVLVFGYQSFQLGTQSLWDEMGRRYFKKGMDWGREIGALVGQYQKVPEGWRIMAQGHPYLSESIGVPVYWHYGGFGLGPNRRPSPDAEEKPYEVVARYIDALGQFTGNANLEQGKTIVAQGCEYAVPMMLQYENAIMGRSYGGPGTADMRWRWRVAREVPSTLIQYTTWNDYNENTILAPGLKLRYAYFDWMGEMIRWWKTGEPPMADHDKVYIFSRDYHKRARVFPMGMMGCAEGAIEVCTILPSAATVRLKGRGEGGADAVWEAPAGMHCEQFPVTPGEVIVEVVRGGKAETRLEHPDPVTDKPCVFNGGINAYSTEFMRHWKADFPDADPAPLLRSLYRDADGDGLPNWFEMLWFGTKGDWSTITQAEPDRDPDRDGLTNLQEYERQTDPTLKNLHKGGVIDPMQMMTGDGDTAAESELEAEVLDDLGEP